MRLLALDEQFGNWWNSDSFSDFAMQVSSGWQTPSLQSGDLLRPIKLSETACYLTLKLNTSRVGSGLELYSGAAYTMHLVQLSSFFSSDTISKYRQKAWSSPHGAAKLLSPVLTERH